MSITHYTPLHGTAVSPPLGGGNASFTLVPWPTVQSKYNLPEDAKKAIEDLQVMIDSLGSTPPTPEQWLQIRECMLKYWASMISHILVSDEIFNNHKQYKLQLEAQQKLMEMQQLQAQWASYAPIVTSTAKI